MRFAVNRIRECVSVSRITDCKHKRAVSLNNARDDRICGVECKAVIRRYFRGVLGICRCTVDQCVFKHIFTGKRLNIVFHLDRSVGGGNPLCGDNCILGGHRCGDIFIPACECISRLRRLCGSGNIRTEIICLFVVNLTVAHECELVGIDGERARYGNVVCGHCRRNAVPSGEGVAGLRGRLDRGYGFTELIDLFLAVLCAVDRISKAVGISAVFKCKRECAVGCDNTRKHRSRFIKSKARESLLFGIAYRVNGIGRTL